MANRFRLEVTTVHRIISHFGQAFINGQLNIPGPKPLPNYPEGGVLPYCIVADEVFPLRMDFTKPFHEVVEYRCLMMKAFLITGLAEHAILLRMFLAYLPKVFQRRLCLKASNVDKVVKACAVLQTIFKTQETNQHCTTD